MKNKFSIIIPTYKSKDYLDLCLYSISRVENINNICEVIVSCDGHYDIVKDVINKYIDTINLRFLDLPNVGMAKAINYAVYQSSYEHLLIINDDNVVPLNLDRVLNITNFLYDDIISFPQIEPKPSIFKCHYIENLGETYDSFNFEKFDNSTISEYEDYVSLYYSHERHLGTFPFLISKKSFMNAGGFDSDYNSPFVTDWDFFVKFDGKCYINTNLYFYHFSSKSSSNPEIKKTEQQAHEYFKFKWGRYGRINKDQTSYLG
jgi:GT2 family glycosyltransferase